MLTNLSQVLMESYDPGKFKVLAGFDGFVDTIQRAIKLKEGGKVQYFETIDQFSTHLQTLSGRSGQVELSVERVKLGGNAPIFSNALAALGIASYCIGSFGLPESHEVFRQMHPLCTTVSVNDPGQSQALEFDDGKIIFSDLHVFDRFNWESIKQRVNLNHLRAYASQCQFIALVDWVNLPEASLIWKGFLEDVIRHIPIQPRHFLFDLCDPSKKSAAQIAEVLAVINDFSSFGSVTLGLNENETLKVWLTLNGYDHSNKVPMNICPPLIEAGKYLFQKMQIRTLLIHPRDRSIAIEQDTITELQGHLVGEPAVLTGGGDNLNAGYCLGRLLGLATTDCLLAGMAASGSYVLNGHSSSINDLMAYLSMWSATLK